MELVLKSIWNWLKDRPIALVTFLLVLLATWLVYWYNGEPLSQQELTGAAVVAAALAAATDFTAWWLRRRRAVAVVVHTEAGDK